MGKLTINHPFSSSLFVCLPGRVIIVFFLPPNSVGASEGQIAWRPRSPEAVQTSNLAAGPGWLGGIAHPWLPPWSSNMAGNSCENHGNPWENSMVSGEDVPQQNQSIETWLETPAPKKWKLFHVKIIEVIEVNGGWQHKSHMGYAMHINQGSWILIPILHHLFPKAMLKSEARFGTLFSSMFFRTSSSFTT